MNTTERQGMNRHVLPRSSRKMRTFRTVRSRTATDLDAIFTAAGATKLERRLTELEKAQISQRIKQARELAGLSQTDLGESLTPPVGQRAVANYEAGRVPFRYLRQIAEITGVSFYWLLHGQEEPPSAEALVEIQEELSAIRSLMEEMSAHQARLGERLAALPSARDGGE